MAQASTIEWTETTWNPVVGCTKVSDGCKNCYAERMSGRLAAMAASDRSRGTSAGRKENYLEVVDEKGNWNTNVVLVHDALGDPDRWKSPRRVFVNSMSDLFHEAVPDSFVSKVFQTMVEHPRHTFQVLTKRPERAAILADQLEWSGNIWLGTSVESADVVNRVKFLQATPANVRFISAEPLLGPIPKLPLSGIAWVIVGGESGPRARPVDARWVTQIRDRALQRGVAFFFKQWGGKNKKKTGRVLDGRTWDEMPDSLPLALSA